MTDRLEALEGNLLVLGQAVDLLSRLDDETYATAGARPGVSAIGAHFRHVFDHYHAFLAGLATGQIDYDARQRNVPAERDRRVALTMARGLLTDMGRVPAGLADRAVRISVRSVAGSGDQPDWSPSSLKRELQFLVSHTVHHYALIKELLRPLDLPMVEGFGVAPSTLAAMAQTSTCAR
jgi:uncharacterized damage-inducible protein DinB